MFVVVQTKHGSRERSWQTFPTALERDQAFERLKADARKDDGDGTFWDGGDYFYYRGNSTTFKVPTLTLFK
jgi:hypothetical protein